MEIHEEDDKLILKYEEDIEPTLDLNRAMRNEYSAFEKKGDFHLAMRVPTIVLLKIAQETGLDFFNPDDAKKIYKILKSPEYKNFRATGAKL